MKKTTQRRVERAREILADRGWRLSYMDFEDPLAEGVGEEVVEKTVKRYMVVESTDGGDDVWASFWHSLADVKRHIEGMARDEWGLMDAFNLDRDAYLDHLGVWVKANVGTLVPQPCGACGSQRRLPYDSVGNGVRCKDCGALYLWNGSVLKKHPGQ